MSSSFVLSVTWEYPYIAPKATFNVTLPMQFAISTAPDIHCGIITTKEKESEDYST